MANKLGFKPYQRVLIALLVVVAMVAIPVTLLTLIGNPQLRSVTQSPSSSISGAIAIPGLPGVVYKAGLADTMARFEQVPATAGKPSSACLYWRGLPTLLKRGLAFVDAKVVPGCASKSYLKEARAEHHKRPQATYWSNRKSYFDLGNPAAPDDYTGFKYSCAYLTNLTKYRYALPPQPTLSGNEYINLTNLQNFDPSHMTAAQKRKLRRYTQGQAKIQKYDTTVFEPIEDIYTIGGNFDKDCYPPGVIFGANDSITFYPAHPVTSIREAAAPVFFSPGGSNTVGVGKPYVIQPGDNPSSVATAVYDDYAQWPLIVAANNLSVPIPDPGSYVGFRLDVSKFKWVVGMTIYLPSTG